MPGVYHCMSIIKVCCYLKLTGMDIVCVLSGFCTYSVSRPKFLALNKDVPLGTTNINYINKTGCYSFPGTPRWNPHSVGQPVF